MLKEFKQIATLLMYCGPDINDLINDAIANNQMYDLQEENDVIVVSIFTKLPYDVNLIDRYFYNRQGKLIKQTLIMDDKEKIIFDKFNQAKNMIENLKDEEQIVA